MSARLMKQFTEKETDAIAADAIKGMTPAGDDSTLLPESNDPPEMSQAKALARRYRLPFVNLLPQDGDSPIDYSLLSEIPVDLMVRNQFVPLRRENGKLHIAMADPTDLDRLDDLAGALRTRLVPHVATAGAIDIVLRKGDATQRVLQEAASGFRISLVRETEQGEEVLDLDRLATDSEMSPIIKLVDTIIYNAMESRASDIHILEQEQINEAFKNLDLNVVGFDPDDLRKFRRYIAEPYGMVLVTGPTGSGKTTSLYAALNEIRNEEDKIITIEDPVEYQLHGITQIPVNEKKGLTFARGLRSILRHDPDKIMVGEIRDEETAQIAIQSALTGHLVFTTVHANNVIDVIGRFLNMGVEPYNFVSSLNCVLAQRLTRVLCQVCKRPYHPTDDELIESGLKPSEHGHRTFYMSVGCDACNHTGYRGRTAIHELLNMSDNCREMIIERRPGSEVRRAAEAEGLRSLREAALEKVFAGVSTLHEINRVTFVEEVKMNGDEIVSVGSET